MGGGGKRGNWVFLGGGRGYLKYGLKRAYFRGFLDDGKDRNKERRMNQKAASYTIKQVYISFNNIVNNK